MSRSPSGKNIEKQQTTILIPLNEQSSLVLAIKSAQNKTKEVIEKGKAIQQPRIAFCQRVDFSVSKSLSPLSSSVSSTTCLPEAIKRSPKATAVIVVDHMLMQTMHFLRTIQTISIQRTTSSIKLMKRKSCIFMKVVQGEVRCTVLQSGARCLLKVLLTRYLIFYLQTKINLLIKVYIH